ncbi:MAG TPA: BamA/TamA family outer membrane protein, partial [Vicinamibacteria bacterium]
GEEVNRAHFRRNDLRLALQRGIKRSWAFEGGMRLGTVRTGEEAGLDFPVGTDDVRTLELGGVVDALDDRHYPTRQLRIAAKGDWSLEALGATQEYWKAEFTARAAIPAGERVILQLDGFAGLSGHPLPVYELYQLGGPVLLPGYHIHELWGAQALAGAVSVRYRVIKNLRAMARVGLGNVWDEREDISFDSLPFGFGLGLYYPTRIGPVAVNAGLRRGGDVLFTFSIGYP